jgi:hypothetical protein
MKKLLFLYCVLSLLVLMYPLQAQTVFAFDTPPVTTAVDHYLARCTDIKYCKKGSRFGKKYYTYIVKCSNGKKLKVTAWDNRKQWCIGMSTRCYKTQMQAAEAACKSS